MTFFLFQISERYGPVCTVHFGPRRVVVLRGYDAVKEALVDQAEAFSGRGEHPVFDWLFQGYGQPLLWQRTRAWLWFAWDILLLPSTFVALLSFPETLLTISPKCDD